MIINCQFSLFLVTSYKILDHLRETPEDDEVGFKGMNIMGGADYLFYYIKGMERSR